jgi:hypothetical protein
MEKALKTKLSVNLGHVIALYKNVLQEDNRMCKLYADTLSDVSENSDNESLDSDSDMPKTSLCKQL